MKCLICKTSLPYPPGDSGYGGPYSCPKCGAKHSYDEGTFLDLGAEMRAAILKILKKRKAKTP